MNVREPRDGDQAALFCDYLDFYRATVEAKLRSLPPAELTGSRLPSGWTPLELLQHLVFMERRWFVWGFCGEDVADPWGDNAGNEQGAGWVVDPAVGLDELVERLHAGGRRTRQVVEGADSLAARAPAGPRYADEPPTLTWTCFHVLQEYARHAGHLDVAVELAGGALGE